MTSHKWVSETVEFNARLEVRNTVAKREMIRKNPHALVKKLHVIKIKIMVCIANNNKCELAATLPLTI
jgi:hypothetical protein